VARTGKELDAAANDLKARGAAIFDRADAGNYRAAGETGELVLDGRGKRIRGS
jgi:hypothetical protein